MAIDVLERNDLPFPRSLPEFQHLSPDETACAAYLEHARWSSCAKLTRRGHDHACVAERGNPQVAEEFRSIIHLVFSNTKTWLCGIHHGVSPRHLQAHLNKFTFRFNRRFCPCNAFRSLLGIAGEVTAPTCSEFYAAKSRPILQSSRVGN